MQIKVISVPVAGGEGMNDELNKFLRGHKVLQVTQELVAVGEGAYWTFCIRYVDGTASGPGEKKDRVDYREVLSPRDFDRFAKLRVVRKAIAEEEGIPAFAVFTDEQLAGMAQLGELTETGMRGVKGVGEKKVERYGAGFIKVLADEKGQ